MQDVTESNFKTEVLESSLPVIVVFSAEHRCVPCRTLAPVLSVLEEENNNVRFVKVNVDESKNLAAAYNVMSVPTIIRFDEGRFTKAMVGAAPKPTIQQELL